MSTVVTPSTPGMAFKDPADYEQETPLPSIDQSREELYTPVRAVNYAKIDKGIIHLGTQKDKENSANYSSSKLVEKCLTDLTEIIEKRKRELHMIQNSAYRSGGNRKMSRLGATPNHLKHDSSYQLHPSGSLENSPAQDYSGEFAPSSTSDSHGKAVQQHSPNSPGTLRADQVRLEQYYGVESNTSPLANQDVLDKSYNMENIGDDVDVDHAVVAFGNSVYEDVHLVVKSYSEEEKEELGDMEESPPSPMLDMSLSRYDTLDMSMENLEEVKQLKQNLKIARVKNSLLKNRIADITNKVENIHTDSKQKIYSLAEERQKVEQKNSALQEDLQAVTENLSFVRKQLESKSAKVLGLENELLYSKQSITRLQEEVHALREHQQELQLQQHQQQQQYQPQPVYEVEDFKVDEFSAISTSAISAGTVAIEDYEAKVAELDNAQGQLENIYPQLYQLQLEFTEVQQERNFLKAQVIDLENKVKDLDNKCFEFEVERAEMVEKVEAPVVVNTPAVIERPETVEGCTMTELTMEELAVEKKVVVTNVVQEIVKVNVPLPYGPHLSKSKHSVVFKKGGYTWMLLLMALMQLVIWALIFICTYLYHQLLQEDDYSVDIKSMPRFTS